MQAQPTPGCNARDRSEAPPSEKSTPCEVCGDPADGFHAVLDAPVCRRCDRCLPARVDLLAALFDAGDVADLAATCRDAGIDDRLVRLACDPAGDRRVCTDGGIDEERTRPGRHTVTSSVPIGGARNLHHNFDPDGEVDHVTGTVEIEVSGAEGDYPIPARLAREIEAAVCERIDEFAAEMAPDEEPTGDREVRTDGGVDPLRVTCRDCGLDRLWYPNEGEEHHPHDRDTRHEVAYEAAGDRPIRCDGGGETHDEYMRRRRVEAAERQAEALGTIADELGYLNGAMTLFAEHVAPGGYTIEAIAGEVDYYRDVRDREVFGR